MQTAKHKLKGSKGNGDMQAAKRDWNAPPTRDVNIWFCGRLTDLSVMGVRVGVANFFSFNISVKIFFFSGMNIVGATGCGDFWALE